MSGTKAKYTVAVREVHILYVDVEADSEEQAMKIVQDGGGDYGQSEYQRTLGTETWTIDKHPEGAS